MFSHLAQTPNHRSQLMHGCSSAIFISFYHVHRPLLICSERRHRVLCGNERSADKLSVRTFYQGACAGRAPTAPDMRRNPAHSGAVIASGEARWLRPLGQAPEVRVHEQRAVARRHRRHLHRRRRVLPGAHVHQPLRATASTASRTLTAARLACKTRCMKRQAACGPVRRHATRPCRTCERFCH
jgi:hypothetical protein